ncbi:uncharacterized protein LOC109836332 [Asparagus officinalis]|uniref:uncharacterized protein LOC109836332 n=1 Tax=Asparagus officinalis TaxID=4686 RepID=UPI00098E6E30|nr:uncharacterized protein LOC109836332 [Asparagus officinalis]
MEAAPIQKRENRAVDEEEESLIGCSFSSLSASSSENSIGSSASSSDLTDDAASSPPSSCGGPLFEMSALEEQLPFKRGLSKFYQGESQSFASFSDIKSFEDLVKPERRALKKLKTSKSCGERLNSNRSLLSLKCCNRRMITKKAPKGPLSSSTGAARSCSLASKPPLHPQRPSNVLGSASQLVRLNI